MGTCGFGTVGDVAGLRSSPPKLGGVAAPSRKCCEATEAGRRRGGCLEETTPPFAKKRANGTPPNLGGEFRKLDSFTSTFQPQDFQEHNSTCALQQEGT